jgi:hypothetical protein
VQASEGGQPAATTTTSSLFVDGLDEINLRRRVFRIQPVALPLVGLLVTALSPFSLHIPL